MLQQVFQVRVVPVTLYSISSSWNVLALESTMANGSLPNILFSSTRSPQGCVLSPLLFVLFTNECQSQHPGGHIIKFADEW